MRFFLTLAVFALTLALMLARPRGLHEAWGTTAQGGDALAFLLALKL